MSLRKVESLPSYERVHEALAHVNKIILEVNAFRETIETINKIKKYETTKIKATKENSSKAGGPKSIL